MTENLLSQLANLRKLFAEAAPDDPKIVSDYVWTVVKVLLQNTTEIDSISARKLLADCLKLPIERPSKLYSALLAAAVKVSNAYPEFRFAAFVRMWDIHNLRPEDNQRQTAQDGKAFPSLVERTAKALGNSIIVHPDTAVVPEGSPSETGASFAPLLLSQGYTIYAMLVTRIKEAMGKDGRKYIFVTLTSADGLEIETISHNLQPSPLHPLPEGKRHFVNIGQLYHCLISTKQGSTSHLSSAYLSQSRAEDLFPSVIGYIESVDASHGHMHIYDTYSRHFVAPVQRFSRERAGDFVRFIPIIPQASKFKTAIIAASLPSSSDEVQGIFRDIRITMINKEKGYAAWELQDKAQPITEQLSPLQLSQGETSPSFTSGFLNLASVAGITPSNLSEGQSLRALIYLKRGKDKQKRPHVSMVRFS